MSHSIGKKEKDESAAPSDTISESNCSEQSELRGGLPDKNSIIKEKQFKSPSGRKYRIFKTSETDEYDKPE